MLASEKNTLTGTLDLDNDRTIVDPNDYTHALNIRNGLNEAGKFNIVTNVKGNTIVPYTQPTGVNEVIGSYENTSDGKCFYFVYNSNESHQIRVYDPNTGVITLIAESSVFGWTQGQNITHINLVDDKILKWTDSKPRSLNVEKAQLEGKAKCWEVYFTYDDTNVANTPVVYALLNGALVGSFIYQWNTQTLEQFADEINNEAFNTGLTAEACGDILKVCQNTAQNGWEVQGEYPNFGTLSIAVADNFYPEITEAIIDAAKYPQNCPPRVQLKQDNTTTYNNIEQRIFQFATRVVYDDFERSVFSPYSDIGLSGCSANLNYIEVNFTEDRLNATNELPLIRAIELYARQQNTSETEVQVDGNWKLVRYIERQDLWQFNNAVGANIFDFYNDGQYTTIDAATAIRQYDRIPIEPTDDKYSISQEFADSRIFYGNFVENYDRPCINADLTVDFNENLRGKRFNISIEIGVYSQSFFKNGGTNFSGMIHNLGDNFPVFGAINNAGALLGTGTLFQQFLPEGGWPVYVPGFEYIAISKQIPIVALPQNQDNSVDTSSGAAINDVNAYYSVDPNPDIYSVATLVGLPAGEYPIRLASHLCSFGDLTGKGDYYDLNNGLAYQQTSTYLRYYVGGVFTEASPYEYPEITIKVKNDGTYEIKGRGGLVIDNGVASPSGNILAGRYYVEDVLWQDALSISTPGGLSIVNGYLVDSNGSSSEQNIYDVGFIGMELQNVTIRHEGTDLNGTETRPTDHNGFFWFSGNPDLGPLSFRSISASSVNGTSGSPLEIKGFADTMYESSFFQFGTIPAQTELGGVLDQFTERDLIRCQQRFSPSVSVTGESTLPGVSVEVYSELLVPNSNPQVSDECRTTISGTVVDSGGVGVGGVSVVYERNGRQEFTDGNGDFSIVVYGDAAEGLNRRILDRLIFNSDNNCQVLFNGFPYTSVPIDISFFGIDYNITVPYAPGFLNPIVGDPYGNRFNRYLKAGGSYKFALMHVDTVNRRHNLYTDTGLEIYYPFITEDVNDYFPSIASQQADGFFDTTVTLNSTPPAWADKLYVLRTKDTIYGEFLQFPISEALYVERFNSDDDSIVQTNYQAGNANKIYLGFEQSILNYTDFKPENKKSWTFQEGDRIRFIRREDASLYDSFIDLSINGSVGGYFVIDNLDDLGEVKAGTLVEVYRRRPQDDEELFYEIHQCIDIENGAYAQTSITLDTGDTYRRDRIVPVSGSGAFNYYIEDDSVSDFYSSEVEDIGRINIDDNTFGRLERTNAIVFSNKYIAGSKTNGLSSFEPLNITDIGRNFGDIKAMRVTDSGDLREVLLTIFENRTVSFYIGTSIITDLSGSDLVSLSNEVLGQYRALKGDYGTINPESLAAKDGKVYFWDAIRRKYVRYDVNGLTPISDQKVKSFADLITAPKVIGAYDDGYDDYVTTYLSETDQNTISFSEAKDGWGSFFSYIPEYYGTSFESLLSFRDGELWRHDTNATRNNFYGTQYNSQVRVINKPSPLSMKMWYHIVVKGNSIWYSPNINTEPDASYPTGMSSRILKGNWGLYEGYWKADFLRDLNDPAFLGVASAIVNARQLRGSNLEILLENDNTSLADIRMVECFISPSEQTN